MICTTGQGNGMVPIKQKAITYTNHFQNFWGSMAALGHNELRAISTFIPTGNSTQDRILTLAALSWLSTH